MAGHIRKRTYRRADGSTRTVWRVRYPDPRGHNTDQIEKQFATYREAERFRTTQGASLLDETHIAPREGARTLASVYDAWRETRWPGLEPKTTSRYAQVWRTHLEPEFGGRKVGSISREHVRRYLAGLSAQGVAAGTVRKIAAVLSAILAEAVELGYVRTNVAAGTKGLPKPANREMLFLTAAEVRALADEVTPYYRTLVLSAAYTGLRAGELLGLRWRNVDLLHGRLSVSEALKEVDGHLTFGRLKTAQSRRTVSLGPYLVNLLREHLATLSAAGPDDLVFPGEKGGPLRHSLFVRRHFRPAVARALPTAKEALRFHDLRHTAASLLIEQGAHPKLIQARLGHSSITLTLDTYGHLFPSIEEALAEKLDAAFTAAAPVSNVALLHKS